MKIHIQIPATWALRRDETRLRPLVSPEVRTREMTPLVSALDDMCVCVCVCVKGRARPARFAWEGCGFGVD